MQEQLNKYAHIVDSLNYYGFGFFIEVTNGIHPNSIKNKISQVKEAQKFFKSLCAEGLETETGIIYIKNYENVINKQINLYLKINNYENKRLLRIISESLNSQEMCGKDKLLIEKILQISDKEKIPLEDLINPSNEAYYAVKKNLLMDKWVYNRMISDIKGLLLENYVADIFKDKKVDRIFTRVEYPYKKNKKKDVDLILIANKNKMKEILREVKNQFCR